MGERLRGIGEGDLFGDVNSMCISRESGTVGKLIVWKDIRDLKDRRV